MRLVEKSCVLEDAFPVDCRAAAGRKNLRGPAVGRSSFSLAPCVCPPQYAVPVPGTVQQVRPVPHQHPGADGKSTGPCLDGIVQGAHKPGIHLCIVIEKNYIRRIGSFNSHIYGMAESGIPGEGNDRYLGKLLFQQLQAAVPGTIVHHQDPMSGAVFLGIQSFQTPFQKFNPVIVGNDYGYLIHNDTPLRPEAPIRSRHSLSVGRYTIRYPASRMAMPNSRLARRMSQSPGKTEASKISVPGSVR